MAWKCFSCGGEITDIAIVKCPHCGYRILTKKRPPVVKKIKTD